MNGTKKDNKFSQLQAAIKDRQFGGEKGLANQANIRTKLAATLILLKVVDGQKKVLMGKRNANLRFMPGALVFPGGRVDRADHFVKTASPLPNLVEKRLTNNIGKSYSPRAAKALGVSAIRELCEETGLIIGKAGEFKNKHPDWQDFTKAGMVPDLGGLRLLGRAVTPPGNVRRFDTWFFITKETAISFSPPFGFDPSGELEELQWISPENAIKDNTRPITRVLLAELMERLEFDPELNKDPEIPFYRNRGGSFIRSMI